MCGAAFYGWDDDFYDTIAMENEVAGNIYERSEPDYLLFNAPPIYADMILDGDLARYLKTVTIINLLKTDCTAPLGKCCRQPLLYLQELAIFH